LGQSLNELSNILEITVKIDLEVNVADMTKKIKK